MLSNFTQPRSIDPPAVIPAEAGIQVLLKAFWIPACAGMTDQLHREKANLDKPAKIYQCWGLHGSFLADEILKKEDPDDFIEEAVRKYLDKKK